VGGRHRAAAADRARRSPPTGWQFAEPGLRSFGGSLVPVRVAGTAGALPVLGTAGVLVDLDAALRVTGDADPPGVFQVWLAPTPAGAWSAG